MSQLIDFGAQENIVEYIIVYFFNLNIWKEP